MKNFVSGSGKDPCYVFISSKVVPRKSTRSSRSSKVAPKKVVRQFII